MSLSPSIWVDGHPATALPLPDRGLDFGDGLFETLLVCRGQALFEQVHLQRLDAGLNTLKFPDCLALARQQLADACATLTQQPWAALRLTVTRGSAPRGYAPPESVTPRIVITAAPLSQDRGILPGPVAVGWSDIRWSQQPLLAGVKHLNRLEQVMAAREARERGLDDVIVRDASGYISSASSANLFLVAGDTLITPRVDTCGIAGTRRRLIIEQWAPDIGMPIKIQDIEPDELHTASELFICNSIRGLVPVAALDAHRWHDHPVCSALHDRYRESLPC